MNTIDSPIEALAFNYATFGLSTLLNNFWACLALLTAALSVWKIRAKSHLPPPPSPSPPPPPTVTSSLNDSPSTEPQRPPQPFVPLEAPGTSRPAAEDSGEVDGKTKGKFTMYYEDDEEMTASETEECDGGYCKSEWWESWENLLRTKRGENAWYKYQDLTELNGNVVRLWDGGFDGSVIRLGKVSRYSSSCMVLAW